MHIIHTHTHMLAVLQEDNVILKKKISDHVRRAVVLRKGEKMLIASLATHIHNHWSSFLLSPDQPAEPHKP